MLILILCGVAGVCRHHAIQTQDQAANKQLGAAGGGSLLKKIPQNVLKIYFYLITS